MDQEEIKLVVKNTEDEISTSFMAEYFRHQREDIRKKAIAHVGQFSLEVQLELDRNHYPDTNNIQDNLSSPDFAKTYERTIQTASLTGNIELHKLLAKIIVDRLYATPETTDALILKSACETMSMLNLEQVRLLAYAHTIRTSRRFFSDGPMYKSAEEIADRFKIYLDLKIVDIDFKYLETTGCLRLDYIDKSIEFYIPIWARRRMKSSVHVEDPLFKKLNEDWSYSSLKYVVLSVVGERIASSACTVLS